MLFIFMMTINVALLLICLIMDVFNNPFLAFLLPIFDCYLLCLIATWLKRTRLSWLIGVLYTIIATTEVFVIFIYHSLFSIPVLQFVVETNTHEASEFLLSALAQPAPWFAISVSAVCWVLAWHFSKKLEQETTLKPKVVSSLLFLLFGLIIWSGIRQVSAYSILYKCFIAEDSSLLGKPERRPHLNTPIVRLLHSLAFNIVQSRELPMLFASTQNTQVDECSYESPLIVLFIGESYNKYHTPLYNDKSLPTTPNLSQMQQDSALITFTNAVTPSNSTSVVLMQMFSTWNEDSTYGWSHHTVFPTVFRKAGYDVAYLSNQFVLNNTDDTWAALGGTIFNNPALSEMQFSWRNDSLVQYDHQLLSYLPDSLVRTDRPRLIIVHLMGQHVAYEYRYPAEFRHFTANDIPKSLGGDNGKQIEAHYANATRYNDFVVSEIWNRFKDQDAIGIYLSDHGEEVYDWRDFYERSNGSSINPEIAHYQYEIPLMVLLSDRYRESHPELASRFQATADRPFISNNLCHMLFHLAGIRTPEYVPERDILSDLYDISRHRIIGEGSDYDELMANYDSDK